MASVKTRTLKQTVTFSAPPHVLYELLMDAKLHAQFTGGPATISRKVGGSFSVFDGYAVGNNLELVKDKKIVQSWRASDWEKEIVSEVSFLFSPSPHSGTLLKFTHSGIPAGQFDSIKQGWIDFYWKPIKEMLKNV